MITLIFSHDYIHENEVNTDEFDGNELHHYPERDFLRSEVGTFVNSLNDNCIIVTDSDFILSAIRVAVRQNVFSHENINIIVTDEWGDDEFVTVDQYGKLSDWPYLLCTYGRYLDALL